MTILTILLTLAIFIPTLHHLISHRDQPGSRRVAVAMGIIGLLLVPVASAAIASFLWELFTSALNLIIAAAIPLIGIGLMIKAIFR